MAKRIPDDKVTGRPVSQRVLDARWKDWPIHPANDAPMMSDAELDELAKDIKKHGLQEPLVYWDDNSEARNGKEGPFPRFLLDGKNRREALKRLGITDPNRAPPGVKRASSSVNIVKAYREESALSLGKGAVSSSKWVLNCDPYKFHLSANAYRRHLKAEQKRAMIESAIAADPYASDRKIARKVGAHHETVGTVRRKSKDPANSNGGIRQKNNSRKRAFEAAKANPDLNSVELAKLAKVSQPTAYRVRQELGFTGKDKDKPKKAKVVTKKEAAPAVEVVEASPNPLDTAWDNASAEQRNAFVKSHAADLRAALEGV